jgi:hypothetical protein
MKEHFYFHKFRVNSLRTECAMAAGDRLLLETPRSQLPSAVIYLHRR